MSGKEEKIQERPNRLDRMMEDVMETSNKFKYKPIKTRSELETLFDLYKLFDKSIHV